MEETKTLEEQKEELFEIAENRFGKEYFEKLNNLVKEYLVEEEFPKYSITVTYDGVFNASKE